MTLNNDKTITIRNVSYSRALLLKMRLELEGIQCFLTNLHEPDTGVDIQLAIKDSEKAYLLLDDMRKAAGVEKEYLVKSLKSVRRILVPVDFSHMSIQAAHYALELARTLKADIRLLNVWFNSANESFVINEMFAFQTNLESIMREMEADAQSKLEELADELKQRIRNERIRGVDVDFDLVRGDAVDAILDITDAYKPGLLVMGTRGKNRTGIGLIGSTTARVIEKSKVPVLTVPSGYDINNFIAPKNVAYITNFDDNDFLALHRLITFVRPFDVKIYCVHSNPDVSYVLDKVKMKKMREYFNDHYSGCNIECGLIENSDSLEGIETFIDEKKIDVIALISRRRNLITQLFKPSLTRKLLFQSDIPILVFRETADAIWKP